MASVLDPLDKGISDLEKLAAEIQKQFRAWSSDPPLDSNRQTRFANKLDGWVATGRGVLTAFRRARQAGAALPNYAQASPEERDAKKLLAGIRALQTEKQLEGLMDRLQRIANHARQPLSPEESRKLWDEFAEFVRQLGSTLDELRAIRELIQERVRSHDDRARKLTEQSRPGRLLSRSPADGATLTTSPVLQSGEEALAALDALDRAIDELRRSIAMTLKDLGSLATAKARRETLASQHEEILATLANYDHRVLTFRAKLEKIEELRGLLDGEESSRTILGRKVEALIEVLLEKSAWCRGWLEIIRRREETAYTLPREVPDQLAQCIRHLDTIRDGINWRAGPADDTTTAVSSQRSPSPLSAPSLSGLGDDDLVLLRLLLGGDGEGPTMNTVADLAEQIGWSKQKVRRLLINRLGENGARVVQRKKGPRTKGNLSPRDIFYIDPAHRDEVRHLLTPH